jgi:hypothetical protein
MNSRIIIGQVAAALLVLGAGAEGGAAAEPKTWYVYCEGASPDGHWAVFSENLWPHPATADYGRRVGDAAKAFFEARHGLALEGCSGVHFRNDSLAEHSRTLTVRLHRRMGDRVYFFPLPPEALPAEPLPAEPLPAAVLPAAAPPSSVVARR